MNAGRITGMWNVSRSSACLIRYASPLPVFPLSPVSVDADLPPQAAIPAGRGAFLARLIDYAGLFPPAGLSLEDAVPNYVAYRRSEEAWMLARFLCPARRLPELAPFTDLFSPDERLHVSVIGTGGDSVEAFLEATRRDRHAMRELADVHQGRAVADAYEVRLPALDRAATADALARLAETMHGLDATFVEVPLAEGDAVANTAEALAGLPGRFGLKMRCGGLTPDAFPSVEQVAFAIAACRDAGVPFKATAGLHHPVRHDDAELGIQRHGFLNVFGAGVLAHALDLDEADLRRVLRSQDLRAFQLDERGFAFEDQRVASGAVHAARVAFATSYGSCSFDEPRDDLRAAGLL